MMKLETNNNNRHNPNKNINYYYSTGNRLWHSTYFQPIRIFGFLNRLIWGIPKLFVAFRYQLHSFTFGIFSKNSPIWMRYGTLGLFIFLLVGKNNVENNNIPPKYNYQTQTFKMNDDGIFFWGKDEPTQNAFGAFASFSEPNDIFNADVQRYVQRFKKTATQEMQRFGIPASILMAQALLESHVGTSHLATKYNNHFAQKCRNKARKCMTTSNGYFQQFDTAWESWRQHSEQLMQSQGKSLRRYGKNHRIWLEGLYADKPDYGAKLTEIIAQYELESLDY